MIVLIIIMMMYSHSSYYSVVVTNYNPLYVYVGFKYLQPLPLSSSHVHRLTLLDEIATKLLQFTIDPNKYETTLAITGAGGFGKTTTVISVSLSCCEQTFC